VAEHALALMLAVARHLSEFDKKIRRGIWEQEIAGVELRGKRVGVIGLGGIGQAMARICNALGMEVICWTRRPSPDRARTHGVVFRELNELLSTSDFISVHLADCKETTKFIGQREFELMKKGLVFVNTSRGRIVDTKGLTYALREGSIGGAGLDVFETEPFSPPHPLFEFENVILTPHVAFNTRQSTINITKIGLQNVLNFMKGRPTNVVNIELLDNAANGSANTTI
jgi:D-3-phosphoglycerate dehydrogenase